MKKIFYILFTAFLFTACTGGDLPIPDPVIPQRTVIAYLCGDNNLSSEVEDKIDALQEGMKRMGETSNHLIVYSDTRNSMPKLWEVTATEAILLKEYTEMNSASADNLNRIIKEIMYDFPAESYGLICFSHASGWLPKGALNNPAGFMSAKSDSRERSIFEDGEYEMSLDKFAEAIPLTGNGDKFEFIIFETCYMAGIEVAWELKDKAKYMVASSAEILSPGMVDIYPDHLADLYTGKPDLMPFSRAYFNHWNGKQGASRSATISVINLSNLPALAGIIKDIYQNGTEADIKDIQHFNRNAGALFFDLSDHIRSIADKEQYTTFQKALDQVVEYQNSTPLFMPGYPYWFSIENHCGLTTYIMQDAYPELNGQYLQSSWAQATGLRLPE